MFVMGGGYLPGTIPQGLGAAAVLLASINVAGGFIITKRMLDMFKRTSVLYELRCFTNTNGILIYRPDRPARILMVVCCSSSRIHGRISGSCEHWNGRPCSSWIFDKQCFVHWFTFWFGLANDSQARQCTRHPWSGLWSPSFVRGSRFFFGSCSPVCRGGSDWGTRRFYYW
jgi:hypothetical protein